MDLRPHLSSIDTLVLAVRLAEIWLTHRYTLEPAERRAMWLRGFTMRAGNRPQEDLVGFGVQAERTGYRRDPSLPGGHLSQLDCQIGAVRVRCVIAHPIAPAAAAGQAPAPHFYRTDRDLLGDPEERYYGNGFRRRRQVIREVQIASDAGRADAVIQVEPGPISTEQIGLGGAYAPALSMLDSMTALAQVAQVLLYHQDGLRRGQTNTLWLRKVTMDSHTPDQPLAEPFPAPVEITASDLVRIGSGRWRAVTMNGYFQGIQARSSLAHQLPE
jgi:hypothetical protein